MNNNNNNELTAPMTELSKTIAALVARDWPRDYAQVVPPCWFAVAHDSPAEEPLEDPDYAPDVAGRKSTLLIAPPTVYHLLVDVSPTGELGSTTIEVYDGQRPRVEGTAGTIPVWPGLDAALAEARLIYLQWETQKLREVAND